MANAIYMMDKMMDKAYVDFEVLSRIDDVAAKIILRNMGKDATILM